MSHYLLGVTGASGAVYAARTLFYLQKAGHFVSLLITDAGKEVADYEVQTAALLKAD